MKHTLRRTSAVLGLVALVPLAALAASPADHAPSGSMQSMGSMGSMGMGMGGKPGGMCPMMGRMAAGGQTITVPTLPPGNEAAQLRMNGEILRAVGEIEQKYASKIHGR